MSFPDTSRWDDATPRSAWYVDRSGATPQVCATDGWSFLQLLQSAMHTLLTDPDSATAGQALPTFAGPPVTDAPVGDAWTVATLAALYALAAAAHAPPDALAAIARDAAAGQVSPRALQTALWLRASVGTRVGGAATRITYGGGTPDAVEVPVGAVMPPLGRALPQPVGGANAATSVACVPTALSALARPAPTGLAAVLASPWFLVGLVAVAATGALVLTRHVPAHGPR